MDLPPAVLDLACRQRGLVTRQQLRELEVSAAQVRWRLSRSWRLVLPGVLLLDWAVPTDLQRCIAGLLYAGPQSWLSGPTAGALHRVLTPAPRSRVHLLVPAPARPRDVGWLSIRRTHVADERVVTSGALRYSCLPRAVVDSAAGLPTDEARALIIEVVQRRLVRLDDLSHWIEARRPNGKAVLRRALAEAAVGAWSLPEAELAQLVSRSSVLPEPWLNPELRDADGCRLTTPDLWFDDVAMAVMVHSREFHGGVIDWEATVDRDSDLSACRVVVIGVTPAAIARDPARVLDRIERAYVTAVRSGQRADVLATPRLAPIGQLLGASRPHRSEPLATLASDGVGDVMSRIMSREVS
jgi:hypothetical protein